MLQLYVADCCGLPESVTFTVIGNVPEAEGVPLMIPLLAFSERPWGSVPPVSCHVNWPCPPVAETVNE